MSGRDLARTEAVDTNLILGFGEALVKASLHVSGRNNDLDFALQPFSERFDNLHFHTFTSWRQCSDSRRFTFEHSAGI